MVAYDQAAFGILVKIGGYQLMFHVISLILVCSDSKTSIVDRRCLSVEEKDLNPGEIWEAKMKLTL